MHQIITQNLRKTFTNGEVSTIALKKIDLTIKKGEFISIMGPSGSGKSTLLHILGFLDVPTKGIYKFEGKTINDYSTNDLAGVRNQKMGFIFQSFNLLRRTSVYNNVRLPLLYSAIPEIKWNNLIVKAIEQVGLSHRIKHLSSQLSGGEQQRVAIARALVNSPDIIFADEPTGNLDSVSGGQIISLLQEINSSHKHTIILVTHETSTAKYAKRIIHMKDGSVIKDEKIKKRNSSTHDFTK